MKIKSCLALEMRILEILLGRIAQWLIDMFFNFTVKNLKRIRIHRKKNGLTKRLFDADARLIAVILDLHPAEIKFAMLQSQKHGFVRGFFSGFTEIFLYALAKNHPVEL